jgi:hypothetical protein
VPAATLGGLLISPSLLSAFVALPTFIHWKFSSKEWYWFVLFHKPKFVNSHLDFWSSGFIPIWTIEMMLL